MTVSELAKRCIARKTETVVRRMKSLDSSSTAFASPERLYSSYIYFFFFSLANTFFRLLCASIFSTSISILLLIRTFARLKENLPSRHTTPLIRKPNRTEKHNTPQKKK